MADTKPYTITIQRVVKEDYTMILEAETAIQAFDEARRIVASRNKTSITGTFSVMKVEEKS